MQFASTQASPRGGPPCSWRAATRRRPRSCTDTWQQPPPGVGGAACTAHTPRSLGLQHMTPPPVPPHLPSTSSCWSVSRCSSPLSSSAGQKHEGGLHSSRALCRGHGQCCKTHAKARHCRCKDGCLSCWCQRAATGTSPDRPRPISVARGPCRAARMAAACANSSVRAAPSCRRQLRRHQLVSTLHLEGRADHRRRFAALTPRQPHGRPSTPPTLPP